MKILVLGAGRVGSAIAVDLAKDDRFEVRAADRDDARLRSLEDAYGILGERVDFSLPTTVTRAVGHADAVISAVPGFLGYRTLQAVLAAARPVVDIAFFPEDPLTLDEEAKRAGVPAIVDCGVAPGMSNVLVAHADRRLDTTTSVAIYVGGLPETRVGPFEYRAVFSPIDVIEEYTRPARVVVDSSVTVRDALSDVEIIHVPGVGDLEAFTTDGLRTLVGTIDAPQMIEKTLRYPGHAAKVQLLRDIGLFSPEPVNLADGSSVRPIDVAAALLFPLWQRQPGERDMTVMRIRVEGVKDAQRTCHTYDLLDRFDADTDTTSMARTTGYAATMALRLVVDGRFTDPGVHPPETLGRRPECVEFLLHGLADRGITYQESIEPDRETSS